MVPPGIPDFATRRRFATRSRQTLEGRAWSGHGAVSAVEVSADGGATWRPAQLDAPAGAHAWRRWTCEWHPEAPGEYELCCRAADSQGNSQPLHAAWNLGGYANNAVQRVPVTVT
jgi:sulfane dehydrogenase subunit SoxC